MDSKHLFSPPHVCLSRQASFVLVSSLLGLFSVDSAFAGDLGLGKQEVDDAFSLRPIAMSVVLAVEVDTTSYYKPGHEATVIYGSGMFWFQGRQNAVRISRSPSFNSIQILKRRVPLIVLIH